MRKLLALLFLLFAACGILFAGEIGHYSALSWGPWDYLSPAKGTGQVAAGFVYYNSKEIVGGSGNGVGTADVDLSLPGAFAVVKYSPKIDILGADYSFAVVAAYGKVNVNAYLSGTNIGAKADKTGWQDINIIPVNLTWALSKFYCVSAQYSFWAPTGNYDVSDALNTGMGYWSHDFRATGSFFPLGNPSALLSVSALFEVNGSKDGTNTRPGNRAVAEIGASYIFNEYFIAGLLAAGNWEITYTRGSDSADDGLDRVFSAGPEATVYIIPGKLSFTLRYFAEFGANDRTEGQYFYSVLGYEF